MSTNSRIGIYENGAVKSIYCHWDGYIEHNGDILNRCYTTREEVQKLIALGDLSSLDETIGVKTDFNTPNPDQCVAYHRDRGEELVISASDLEHFRTWEEYNYVFKDGEWWVSCDETDFRLRPLKEFL